jgi:hypothetical protein
MTARGQQVLAQCSSQTQLFTKGNLKPIKNIAPHIMWFVYRILFTAWHLCRKQKLVYTNISECIQIIFHSLGQNFSHHGKDEQRNWTVEALVTT